MYQSEPSGLWVRDKGDEGVSQSRLKELLKYNPETGEFTRLTRLSCKVCIGSIAGSLSHGYVRIGIDKEVRFAHVWAFLYMTGKLPTGEVDHIDGNPLNNSWNNLRIATRSENIQNLKKAKSNSKTGVLGVFPHSKGRYCSQIRVKGTVISLGIFSSLEEAKSAYLSAKRELHPFGTL